eukprot:gnl/Spiro4/29478_TR14437_c0_g1_i1.p1 gnl/Spiro4/29478_TR14437_c0_g1~~gnl/Spiro4/29478_TR14437_c0_g1_i1.p1  ORF type:complete len:291 (+),score=39.98 gnl/Spiro4/29478_TR14437_c0_g1_i1:186-1058(+)
MCQVYPAERERKYNVLVPRSVDLGQFQEVWASNLEEEMKKIRDVIDRYSCISLDTEFPGVVARPIGNFRSNTEFTYQTMRCNVDLLKIIQLGLTFSDDQGNLPEGTCTWQFNFKFNLNEDMYAQDSIDLLQRSGVNFARQEQDGIDVHHFGELLMMSGIVLNDEMKWISFHSCYDFGYLLKLLTCEALPSDESDFFKLLRSYFPCIFDVKYLVDKYDNLKTHGLSSLAVMLELERVGPCHQAGSDSLLTAATYYKLRETVLKNEPVDKYSGMLYGLGKGDRGVQVSDFYE